MTIPSDSVPFPGATPRPWRVIRPDSNGCEVCPEIWADRKWVATVTGAPHLGFNESLPNAALIVAAVNSHEPLTKERDALRTERDHWKKCYYDVADAVARESTSCEDLCRQATETRRERDALKDEVQRLRDAGEAAKELSELGFRLCWAQDRGAPTSAINARISVILEKLATALPRVS
jgi:hypothetical protein